MSFFVIFCENTDLSKTFSDVGLDAVLLEGFLLVTLTITQRNKNTRPHIYIYMLMHLEDTFIQSDLQSHPRLAGRIRGLA